MDVSSPRTDALSMEPSAKLFCCGFVRRCIPLVYREELYHILRMTGPLLVCRFLNFLLFFVVTMFCGRLGNTVLAGYAMASAAMFLYQLQLSYLQNQGVIKPQMYASAVANVANVIVNYFLLYWWDFGVYGSAAANTFGQVFNCFALFCFIRWQKLHEKTWGGWSSEAFQDWGSYMKLAIPSTLMTCFEWWIYEVGGFLAGMLSEVDLAAQHVVIMLAYINYMIPLGMQGAACVRVGNALGAGETAAAIFTSKVSLISSAVIAIFQGFVLGSTKTVIGYIFTSDEAIAELVSQLLSIYCPLQFFNGILCVGMGILLGTGQQKIAAIANLFGYYCIGLPSSIVLMFTAKLQVAGFWLGLLIAVFLLAIFFTVAIFRLNWKKMTEEAIERTGKSANGAANGTMTPSHRNSFYQVVLNAENGNGYVVVSSHDQDEGLNHTTVHEGPNETHVEEKPAVLLSTAQLILRRGLTTLGALLILAVGIAVHLTVPLPEVSYGAGANFTLDSNFTTATPF
ncbi:multidrug and toxin extrusion 1-like protein [Labeo rohita]|uniref:Multidrug and toxin extrusion protein n=1 Tax=Labeo rohita TaxID=84645 RepID=A0A498LJE7_LABRO|nr:multidrug and toxin extrusion 1-like protein [Labeo rohita]